MEDQYNVLRREEERDMIPLCVDQGVGLTPLFAAGEGPCGPALGRADRTVKR